MLDYTWLYWYIIWCTSSSSFSLVGWLVGCCCCWLLLFRFCSCYFNFHLKTKVNRALGTQRQQLEQRTIASAPLGYRWFISPLWVVFVLYVLLIGVCLDIFCVSSRQLDFTIFSSNNMEFIMRSFRSKKTTTATWRHHEKSPASPCFLRYRVATAMLGTSVVASLGWHGEIRIDFFPFGTSVKYFWANLRLYKLHLFQSFPPS